MAHRLPRRLRTALAGCTTIAVAVGIVSLSALPAQAAEAQSPFATTASSAVDATTASAPAAPAPAPTTAPQATALTTNDLTDPLGVGGDAPRLSWQVIDPDRGSVQSAYRVRAASSAEGLASGDTIWDSGKVDSDQSVDVDWAGPELASSTRYFWQVQVWDGTGAASDWSAPAWFETGLLEASDWSADWVGAQAESRDWTDYTLTSEFSLVHPASSAIGFFFRSPDAQNGFMWQINSGIQAAGKVYFRPHDKVNGGYNLLGNQDITSIIAEHGGVEATHTITVQVVGDTITTSIDGVALGGQFGVVKSSNHPSGGIGLRTSGTESALIKNLTVVSSEGESLFGSTFGAGGTGTATTNPLNGGTPSPDGLAISGGVEAFQTVEPPIVRGGFTTDPTKTIASARAYASAQGLYQLNLNGAQVGDQYLAPGWTDYSKTYQYQTYDITSQVVPGANALGAQLADGWFAGTLQSGPKNVWGSTSDLSLIAQVLVTYTDGTSQTFGTDGSWTTSTGPVVAADLYNGETYDATREQTGWDTPAFDASTWAPAVIRPSQTAKLRAQSDQPVRITSERPALTQTEPTPGAFVYDLGQNMVGTAALTLTGKAGQQARIRYAEVLNPDGTMYTANLRSAKVTDYYTFAADGTASFHPTLTQHGFRYVEVTGVDTAPALTDVVGTVWNSAGEDTVGFTTSNALVNQLQSNITWGQRGNFVSIPTDTPARDERLGWTGDISEFASTATYNLDSDAFLTKWLRDLRTAQSANGAYPDVAPNYAGMSGNGNSGWADAGVTVPFALWQSYGNTDVLEDGWSSMTKYMDYLAATSSNFQRDGGAFRDWLNLNDETASNIIGTAYYAHSADLMSQMAAAIGNTADADKYRTLYENIRSSYQDAFIGDDGALSSDTQTGYVITIMFGLVPDAVRDQLADRFVATLERADWHLSTGFLGVKNLLPALTAIDRTDVAYRLLLNTDYPSWGYEIANGATTIWERWNSIMPDGSFGDVSMNSFNHYAYGAVGAWMYGTVGGISALEPGYRKTLIAPVPGGGLTSSAMDYRTPYGTVSSHWSTGPGSFDLTVAVPANTTARVVVPAQNPLAVTEGGSPLTSAAGIVSSTDTGDTVTIELGSGDYDFAVESPAADLASVKEGLAAFDQLVEDADLTGPQRTALQADSATAAAAVDAGLADPASAAEKAGAALSALQDAKALVATDLTAGPLDQAGADALVAALDPMIQSLNRALVAAIGISVGTTGPAGELLPGQTETVTVTASNTSAADIADVGAALDLPEGWTSAPAAAERVTLAAGASNAFTFQVTVPVDATIGSNPIVGRVDVPITGGRASTTAATSVTVASPVTLTATAAPATAAPGGYALVTVALHNRSTATVTGTVQLGVPEGWTAPAASAPVTLAPGADASVPVSLVVPASGNTGTVPGLVAGFASAGQTLATAPVPFALTIGVPDAATAIDYLDMGSTASTPAGEAAHAVTFSSRSGNSPDEAGLTRRYTYKGEKDGFIQFTMKITKGQPFVLRTRETYDGPQIKDYEVLVNGQTVESRMFEHTSGMGTEVYQVVVDDPALLTGDTVTVRFQNNPEGRNYDPSIADVWTLPVPAADTVAPVTTASFDDQGGTAVGPVAVTLAATDDVSGVASTTYSVDGSPAAVYTAPFEVSGAGAHTVTYRSTDVAGNTEEIKTATLHLVQGPPEVDRFSGVDRFETAVTVSKAGFETADTVYLTSGETFPDALSAAPAAAVDGSPILLTNAGSLPSVVRDEIIRLTATHVVIVGGPNSVGAAVEADLQTLVPSVTRIGGVDRYEASRNVASTAFPTGADVAVIATGTSFPDALSAGAAVAAHGPVILVDGSAPTLDAATVALLKQLDVDQIVVAGGPDTVSAGILAQAKSLVPDTVRLSGADRYATSRAINAHFFDSTEKVLIATGLSFPDALSGSALAARVGGPLFTVPGTCIPSETLAQITALGAKDVALLGGENTLSPAVADLTVCAP
ncbi:family 78 glycoside hydrolase catalytic domain [Herbiconiux solani]|uniref:family 78 glycoside hydrolase catalytic domain n=1 Tax=Herbiconiux solani TaxID=661329 RepID=UPI00082511E6|nr:family 78 glycoside hydrolase catalytic domain [Herbiconiux solani]